MVLDSKLPTMKEADKPKIFAELGVREELAEACDSLGWKAPTKIQIEAIPYALNGRDVIGLAQTGSGKTGAFALPILHALLDKPHPFFACVLSPMRELAIQIGEQFEALGSSIGVKCSVECYLVYILTEMPDSMAMVFTRTCESTRLLAELLRNLRLKAIPISGQMSQIEQLIGKKLPDYPADEALVLMHLENVMDAKRIALMKLKEINSNKRRRKGEDDEDEDLENFASTNRKGFASTNQKGSKHKQMKHRKQ